jgi:hypothetical protein
MLLIILMQIFVELIYVLLLLNHRNNLMYIDELIYNAILYLNDVLNWNQLNPLFYY